MSITSIEPVGTSDAYCIQVDSPDGLFLAGRDLVPTHNSTLTSVVGSLWALQQNPDTRVMITANADSLAMKMATEARDWVSTHGAEATEPITRERMPDRLGFSLAAEKSAGGHWRVKGHKGGIYSAGVGGNIVGRPADLMVIDDPFKSWIEADSPLRRSQIWQWWEGNVKPRLAPHAPVIVVMCMTGDTPVLMGTGCEKPLRDVRPGDVIATYENGALVTSTVRNWANQGPDSIYSIRMKSGRTVRANARHPFLTVENGQEVWQRTDTLKKGSVILTVIGANGTESSAPQKAANSKRSARVGVCPTTTNRDGQAGSDHYQPARSHDETHDFGIDTKSNPKSTPHWSNNKRDSAVSAVNLQLTAIPAPTGTGNCASTTITKPDAYADCCAMTATSLSGTGKLPASCVPQLTTWNVTPDEVVEVTPCGTEEVFDLQVDRTENFIANGLVSHNTRWHEEDLAGQLELTGDWEVINIPAISEPEVPDALGRDPGVQMESAREGRDFFEVRRGYGGPENRTWSAQYMGRPTPSGGTLFSKAWFNTHRTPLNPTLYRRITTVDPAETGKSDEVGIMAGGLTSAGNVVLTDDASGMYTSDQWSIEAVLLALRTGSTELVFEAYTTETTYHRILREAWRQVATDPVKFGFPLGVWNPKSLPPFRIVPWRGKGNALARSSGLRQATSTGRCAVEGYKLSTYEEKAIKWQEGQHQPDRVAAATILFHHLAGEGGTTLAAPITAGGGHNVGGGWGVMPDGMSGGPQVSGF